MNQKTPSVLITCRLKSNFSLPSCSVSLQTQRAESHPTTVYRDTQRDIALHPSSRFPRCSPARRIGPIPLQHHADLSYRRGGTPRIKPCDIWTLSKLRLSLQVSCIGDELVSTDRSLTLKRGCCSPTGYVKVVWKSLISSSSSSDPSKVLRNGKKKTNKNLVFHCGTDGSKEKYNKLAWIF